LANGSRSTHCSDPVWPAITHCSGPVGARSFGRMRGPDHIYCRHRSGLCAHAGKLVGGNTPFVELTKLHAACCGLRTSVVVGVEALPGGPTGAVSQFSTRTERRVSRVVNDKKPHRSSKKVRCGCMEPTDLCPDCGHAPDWWSLRAIPHRPLATSMRWKPATLASRSTQDLATSFKANWSYWF